MVLNYHGLVVNQQQIVHRIYGNPNICRTGNAQQIMTALSGWAPNVAGGNSQIHCWYGVYNSYDIVDQLSRRWPIIVGLHAEGHAYVLTAVYFTYNQFGAPVISKVVLRDPWPDNPSKKEMSWTEFIMKQPEFFKAWVKHQ